MKKTIIIVVIALLAICAICLGIFIALMPEPVEPAPVDIHTDNSLVKALNIQRPDTRVERLLAIRTYQGADDADELIADMIKIGEVGCLEYWELNDKGDDYLLVVPFEINGKLQFSSVKYNEYEELYLPDKVVKKGNDGKALPDNYSMLIRYSRPDNPELEIELIQNEGEQTATYQIVNTENGSMVKKTQFVKDDVSAGTESVGVEIKKKTDEAE